MNIKGNRETLDLDGKQGITGSFLRNPTCPSSVAQMTEPLTLPTFGGNDEDESPSRTSEADTHNGSSKKKTRYKGSIIESQDNTKGRRGTKHQTSNKSKKGDGACCNDGCSLF